MVARASILSLVLVTPLAACAQQNKGTEDPDLALDSAQVAQIRLENQKLRRKVKQLEEQLRLANGPGANSAVAGMPNLPVVKLSPPEAAERASAPPPEATPDEAPPRRRGVSLDPVPHSSPLGDGVAETPVWESSDAYASTQSQRQAAAPAPTPAPAAAPASEAAEASAGPQSYRLVGSHLVEATQRKRPKKPKKSRKRTRRGSGPDAVVSEYEQAMAVYKSGRYADAEKAFSAIVAKHGSHDYADNALYWKGEAAYDQRHFSDALSAFTEVVERYGGGNKAPDALLKIGLCYGKLGDTANAKDVFTQLIAAYPRAHATKIARTKLTEYQAG